MFHFECGTLVPGCKWHTEAETEAEVIRRVVAHLKTTHNETVIRDSMIEAIKARIRNGKVAA